MKTTPPRSSRRPGLRFRLRPGDEQHGAGRMRRLEREQQPPAEFKRLEPGARRVRRRARDIDGVGLRQALARTGRRADLDLRERREIVSRPLGDVRLDLVGDHFAGRADQMGEDGGVIAGPRADLQNRLALRDRQRLDARRMQRRLAVVDAARRVDGDQDVVVERGDVGFARRAETATGYVPGRRAGKVLARNRGEGGLDFADRRRRRCARSRRRRLCEVWRTGPAWRVRISRPDWRRNRAANLTAPTRARRGRATL